MLTLILSSMMTMEKGDEDAILPTLAYRENEKID